MSDTNDDSPASEALEEARRVAAAASRNKWVAAGVATGVGSAALVAALLYANRDKDGKKRK